MFFVNNTRIELQGGYAQVIQPVFKMCEQACKQKREAQRDDPKAGPSNKEFWRAYFGDNKDIQQV